MVMKALYNGIIFAAFVLVTVTGDSGNTLLTDNNQLFLYNKAFEHYRLGYPRQHCENYLHNLKNNWAVKIGYKVVNNYCPSWGASQQLTEDELWRLEAHPSRTGYFYVKNSQKSFHKLLYGVPNDGVLKRKNIFHKTQNVWTPGKIGNIIVSFDNRYSDSYLFKFVPAGGDYFTIRPLNTEDNKELCLSMKSQFWVETRKCEYVSYDNHAKWKLVPRIDAVSMKYVIICARDHRQHTLDAEISVAMERGLVRTTSSEIRDLQSYKVALEASIEYGLGSATMSFEFTQEIEKTITNTQEDSWKRTVTEKMIIPAHTNYMMVQNVLEYSGPFDAGVYNGGYKVYTSDSSQFYQYDDNGNIISTLDTTGYERSNKC